MIGRKVPAWMAALPLNRDEEWVDVMDLDQPRRAIVFDGKIYEDYTTRRVHRLTPVRVHHFTPHDNLAVVEFR